MAAAEGTGVLAGQPNLHKQDLLKLDVSKLTALSPEVISRQATINIGTIGHVAHGKSTVVKAISGVQTVRFKNELERNITIKLERLQFDANGKITCPKRLRSVRVNPACFTKQRKTQIVPKGIKRKQQFDDGPERKRLKTPTSKRHEVEKILKHKVEAGKQMFLVKWIGYPNNENTWEPLENMDNCPQIMRNFLTETVSKQVLNALSKMLNLTHSQLKKQTIKMLGMLDLNALPDKLALQKELLSLGTTPPKVRHVVKLEEGTRAMLLYQLVQKREAQLEKLQKWETYINNKAKEDAIIKVENAVDLEGPPRDFIYINENIAGKNVKLPTKAETGCACKECGPRLKQCCGRQDPNSFNYRNRDKINIIPGMAIYECNDLCKCGPDCRNRVVQKGRKIPLCIFRTANGCGWGVKALRKIYQGEFICEYVGEVITHDEAEIRGQAYDARGRTYLFDLDFNSMDNPYTIDAGKYGNLSHFINHSCDPNLAVWSVWINSSDPNLPRLAMFSLKGIEKGEELTFDYMSNYAASPTNTPDKSKPKLETPEKNANIANGKGSLCRCSADSCRRYLFG